MTRPSSALTVMVVGVVIAASVALGQQAARGTGDDSADNVLDPMAAARSPHHLLRNGLDYLNYQEYERALSFLRQAEARKAELNSSEVRALRDGIEQAQKGMREAANMPRRNYAKSQVGGRPGAIVTAQPEQQEPIQLTSVNVAQPANVSPARGARELSPPPPLPAMLPEQVNPASAVAQVTESNVQTINPVGSVAPLVAQPLQTVPVVHSESPRAVVNDVPPTQLRRPPSVDLTSLPPLPPETPAAEPVQNPAQMPVHANTALAQASSGGAANVSATNSSSRPFEAPKPVSELQEPANRATSRMVFSEAGVTRAADEPGSSVRKPAPLELPPLPAEIKPDNPATSAVATTTVLDASPMPESLQNRDNVGAVDRVMTVQDRVQEPRDSDALNTSPPVVVEPSAPQMPSNREMSESSGDKAVLAGPGSLVHADVAAAPLPATGSVSRDVRGVEETPKASASVDATRAIVSLPESSTRVTELTRDDQPEINRDGRQEQAPAAVIPDAGSLSSPAPLAVPVTDSDRTVSSDRPGRGSSLSPELQSEVARIAQMQEEAARRARTSLGASRDLSAEAEQPTARLELPRAPSPTEARPLRAISVPEEFVPLAPRDWTPSRKYWAAAATCHSPLYFQDAVLERYGYSVEQRFGRAGRFLTFPLDDPTQSKQRNQILQPLFSYGLFAFQIVALPYNLLVDPPWEAEYDLGYYRPGDRVPTDVYYLPWHGIGPPLHGMNY